MQELPPSLKEMADNSKIQSAFSGAELAYKLGPMADKKTIEKSLQELRATTAHTFELTESFWHFRAEVWNLIYSKYIEETSDEDKVMIVEFWSKDANRIFYWNQYQEQNFPSLYKPSLETRIDYRILKAVRRLSSWRSNK